jgi:hypothetical protein
MIHGLRVGGHCGKAKADEQEGGGGGSDHRKSPVLRSSFASFPLLEGKSKTLDGHSLVKCLD